MWRGENESNIKFENIKSQTGLKPVNNGMVMIN